MAKLGGLVLSFKHNNQIRIQGPDGQEIIMRMVSGGRSPRVVFHAPDSYQITREMIDGDNSNRDGDTSTATEV